MGEKSNLEPLQPLETPRSHREPDYRARYFHLRDLLWIQHEQLVGYLQARQGCIVEAKRQFAIWDKEDGR